MKDMWYIKSFNFTCWNAQKFNLQQAKEQIMEMVKRCSINTVNFAFGARQDHCYSTIIGWQGPHMLSDDKLIELIKFTKEQGLKVIVKPMVNPADGYWRAYIRFFDEDVPCEPKWRDWFANYTEYILHYAELCEKLEVEMIIVGCELVGTDHRHKEWREIVSKVRERYSGLLTYNCDKYQEHNISWWDVLDVISSSGYYPLGDWEVQLDRISKVVAKYNKPFFFSECGCPSTREASKVPNDWTAVGKNPVALEEQADFFKTMFERCHGLKWHFGYSIWDWPANIGNSYSPMLDGGYHVLNKPSEAFIKKYFNEL